MTSSISGFDARVAGAFLLVFLAGFAALFAVPARTDGELPARLSEELGAAAPVDVVVLGNSVAAAAIDPVVVRDWMAGQPLRAAVLAHDGTFAGHWFLELRDHVFGKGHRPRVVVFYATTAMFAANMDVDAMSRQMYFELAGAHDPLVVERVYGSNSLAATRERTLDARVQVREALLDTVVHRTVAAVHGGSGAAQVRMAASRLQSYGQRGGGGFSVTPPTPPGKPQGSARPQGFVAPVLFVRELAELARTHGGRAVFVLAPQYTGGTCASRPGSPLASEVASAGADLIDMTCVPLTAECFVDSFHVAPACSRTTTEAFLDALERSGALRGERNGPPILEVVDRF